MIALLIALLPAVAASGPAPCEPPAERAWVETADGAFVALHRRARDGAPPVVLVHGIASNHRFWDLEEGRSLACHLQQAGYDVWNLDLRGHGDAIRGPDGRRQRAGWTIDDYAVHDLPAAFDRVLAETGASQVHYVGHSLGGMVLAAYLATRDEWPLASAVVVGSPLDFRDPDVLVAALLGAAPVMNGLRRLPLGGVARVYGAIGRSGPMKLDALLHNPDLVERSAERRMLRTVVSPLTVGEARQLALARDGEFRSTDGAVVYREALRHVTVPMLFVAGRADHIVSPDRVRAYFDAVGSDDKALVLASRANGMAGDYGHLDLGLGDHVTVDIFPRITAWLDGHGP